MKKTILALALAAGLTSFAGSAKADSNPLVWNWNLTGTSTSSLIGSGQFTTGSDQGGGSYLLNSISGTYAGVTITGLDSYSDASNVYYDFPSGYNVDFGGIAFATSTAFAGNYGDGDGMVENIFGGKGKVNLFNNANDYGVVSFNVTAAVPEPSTYALFGIGALALVVVYRRRVA